MISRIFVRSAVKVRCSLAGVLSSSYTSVHSEQLPTLKTNIYIYIYIYIYSCIFEFGSSLKKKIYCPLFYDIYNPTCREQHGMKNGIFFCHIWGWDARLLRCDFFFGFVLLCYSLYNKMSQPITLASSVQFFIHNGPKKGLRQKKYPLRTYLFVGRVAQSV